MNEKRLAAIADELAENEAAIVTDDNNRFYLTGVHSSAGTVVITKAASYLLIDFRYYEMAKNRATGVNVVLSERYYEQLCEILSKHNITAVCLESNTVTLAQLKVFEEKLIGVTVNQSSKLSDILCKLRSIKSPFEVDCIKQAQKLTDDTFYYILNRIKSGVTENQVMLDMEFFMRSRGSEGVSFDFIVVSGVNSSLPHGVPTEKVIENGDFVTMDFGAVVNGYRSDMTRTVAVGSINEEQQTVYETVLEAQRLALEAIKPQVECCAVDKIARDFIADKGFGKCFGHGLGHSVGLEIHESPACSPRDKTPLEEGMIMTVEPGIYIENKFGVRIEDMVLVTKTGCENLTHSPKELIILNN